MGRKRYYNTSPVEFQVLQREQRKEIRIQVLIETSKARVRVDLTDLNLLDKEE